MSTQRLIKHIDRLTKIDPVLVLEKKTQHTHTHTIHTVSVQTWYTQHHAMNTQQNVCAGNECTLFMNQPKHQVRKKNIGNLHLVLSFSASIWALTSTAAIVSGGNPS